MKLQLFYDRHRAELRDQLPDTQFATYFQSFITDALEPEVYEERTELVAQMLRDRLQLTQTTNVPQFTSMEDVLRHFDQQKQCLMALVTEPDMLDSLMTTLDESRDNQMQRFLQ